MRGLYARIAIAFICVASGVLLISTIAFVWATYYHFSMYQKQTMDAPMNAPTFGTHFEQALIQSVLISAIIGILLAVVLSLFVAKRITAPLIHMKEIAEQMANGDLAVRTAVRGNDELTDLGGSLNHLAAQLVQQEHLRKTMTADVAHELRTPLTTLKSHIEAMIDGVWEPTPTRLASCFEEVERLRYLVGDLEQLTEMESPDFKLNLQDESVTSLIQHQVEAHMASFEQKGVDLLSRGSSGIKANLDRQRLGQILANLLTNALKFTPPGGKVAIDVHEETTHVVVVVSDTGRGIHGDDLPYVFERFYRVDKSRERKTGGSGIGLTIVKKLVEAHGGTIRIESELGIGTTVYIHFPL
ncbi:two-component sensor histidine kinase [Paenibacillus pectinilyticus]|uniref:histidine kinase n=1 Tax=Paenibacillus pectinilyticus TaxID=512399 RepID=A0A1C1A046_9BACL|nr:ATP-binding protein [Paenibacillus pectinilyticus]OCT13661.1 two-component sensor histidine kinase [Paenibacillus pectinilyticus]